MDTGTVLAVVSLLVSAFVGFTTIKRNKNNDDKKETTEFTTIAVRLESISGGIAELKSDFRHMSTEQQAIRERLVLVEQSVKSAHHRIDTIQGKGKE